MRWAQVAALVLGVSLCVAGAGCFTSGVSRVLPGDSLLDDLTEPAAPNLTRLQQSEDLKAKAPEPPPLPAPPASTNQTGSQTLPAGQAKSELQSLKPPPVQPAALQPPVAPPPQSAGVPPLPKVSLPKPQSSAPQPDVQQASLKGTNNARVAIRAWVNGRPVLDTEVMHILQSRRTWYDVMKLPEPQRSEQMATAFSDALDTVIEQETMYQDAIKKLEKNNPRALEKLKQAAAAEFDKELRRIRENNKQVAEEEIKEFEASMRRHMERSFVSMEYVRSRIIPYMNSRISLEEIERYFTDHPSEFQKQDAVEWQDIFIAVSPKLPTVPH